MLVLSRKLNEQILIDGNIRITVVGIRGNQVRLGIQAPDSVKIFRAELLVPASVAPGAEEPLEGTLSPTASSRSRIGQVAEV